jgi:hypothetical protein
MSRAKSTLAAKGCQRGNERKWAKTRAFFPLAVGLQRLGEVGGKSEIERVTRHLWIAAEKRALWQARSDVTPVYNVLLVASWKQSKE